MTMRDEGTLLSPTVTPGRMMAPPPIHTSCPMLIGRAYSSPRIAGRPLQVEVPRYRSVRPSHL